MPSLLLTTTGWLLTGGTSPGQTSLKSSCGRRNCSGETSNCQESRLVKCVMWSWSHHYLTLAGSPVGSKYSPGFDVDNLLFNGLVWGCLMTDRNNFPFKKTALFDRATIKEQSTRNEIYLTANNYNLVRQFDNAPFSNLTFIHMNTTSLVFIQCFQFWLSKLAPRVTK